MSNRSIVYIDGFNLYYGALKGTKNKWLDLETYFKRLRQTDEIQKIWYFTAEVTGNTSLSNQRAYLDALAAHCPLVEVKYGLFKKKNLSCRVTRCTHTPSKQYSVYEEKGTDVNIALQMIDDVYQNLCERTILVSGDSDLVPALELVKKRFPQTEITVYIPSQHPKRGAARELRGIADKDRTLPLEPLISRSQMPGCISSKDGKTITKPNGW